MTKHLAANAIELKFATPERQSKIDPFAEKLVGWRMTDAGTSRKKKRTVKQVYAALVNRLACLGGGICRKVDCQREQQTKARGTCVPLRLDCGDVFQFDRSEDAAVHCPADASKAHCREHQALRLGAGVL